MKMKMMMSEVLTVPVCRKGGQVRLTSWLDSLIPATAPSSGAANYAVQCLC